MRQFQLMNIPGDYERVVQGHSHKEREKLRVGTLHAQIESANADLGEGLHAPPMKLEPKQNLCNVH